MLSLAFILRLSLSPMQISITCLTESHNTQSDMNNSVIILTHDQLRDIVSSTVRETIESIKGESKKGGSPTGSTEYVYGISGIRRLFNVSHTTAQRYKNTFLAPAISQRGRTIAVNAAYARQLFSEYQSQ